MERMRVLYVVLFLLFSNAGLAGADVETELKAMKAEMSSMKARMHVLEQKVSQQAQAKVDYERRIEELETQLAVQQQAASSAVTTAGTAKARWTPEIGVVADIVGRLDSGKMDEEGSDRLSVRELELVVGSAVDPYSRFDATMAFSDFEDPALEEAYLTRFGLPSGTTARLGKFKPNIGKVIRSHRDGLETVDQPIVIQRYFGVEGYNKSGVDLTKNLDLPWHVSQQISVGVLEGGNGEEGTAFGEARRRPTLYTHLKNYVDLTESTGLEGGISYLTGSRDEDSAMEVQILGLDGTFTHQFNSAQAFKMQGEAFHLGRTESYREEDDGLGGTMLVDSKDNFWGAYGLADLRFLPRWSTGFRYDFVQQVDVDSNNGDNSYTGYLTFHQTEFSRWRTQFTHTDFENGKNDNAVFLQGTFVIGDHKHKLQ